MKRIVIPTISAKTSPRIRLSTRESDLTVDGEQIRHMRNTAFIFIGSRMRACLDKYTRNEAQLMPALYYVQLILVLPRFSNISQNECAHDILSIIEKISKPWFIIISALVSSMVLTLNKIKNVLLCQ
jgi:hypothetical protein